MDEKRFKIIIQNMLYPYSQYYRAAWFAPQFHNLSVKNYKDLVKDEYVPRECSQKSPEELSFQNEEWILVGKN